MRKYIVSAVVAVTGVTGTVSAIALGQSPTHHSTEHHAHGHHVAPSLPAPQPAPSKTSDAPVTPVVTESPAAVVMQVPPAGLVHSVGLVALPNRDAAQVIVDQFGVAALWAWNVSTQSFVSVVNTTVQPGVALYAEYKTRHAALAHLVAMRARHHHHHTTTTTTEPSAPVTETVNAPAAVAAPAPPPPAPAPAPAAPPAAAGAPTPDASAPGPWTLKFDDEFNGSSLDTSNWSPYWFSNGSSSNNTTMESSNVSVSGGNLNLALNGSSGGLVSSNGHYSFTYGYAEARIYLPPSGSQVANWPAWWTDGQSWPADGEMDVMEGLGGSACYHFHSNSGGPGSCASGNYSGWHTYGADWEPGKVTYYYDGKAVGTITTGITAQPMYLILENSDGSYGGSKVTPATMQVDYVRVYQHS